jgi:hypothetical protein
MTGNKVLETAFHDELTLGKAPGPYVVFNRKTGRLTITDCDDTPGRQPPKSITLSKDEAGRFLAWLEEYEMSTTAET